jgi:hypothetical protein
MLFTQIKSLTFCIFATIVACQSPDVNYVIRNQASSNVLAAASPAPDNSLVIIRPQGQGPVQLAEWTISRVSPIHFIIKTAEADRFLSDAGNRAILGQEDDWIIERRGSGYSISPSSNPNNYLTSDPSPGVAILAPFNPSASLWTFEPPF